MSHQYFIATLTNIEKCLDSQLSPAEPQVQTSLQVRQLIFKLYDLLKVCTRTPDQVQPRVTEAIQIRYQYIKLISTIHRRFGTIPDPHQDLFALPQY